MKPQLSPKLTMKTAHIWNSLANMHACIPWSLASSFYKWKKPPLYRAQDSGGFPWGQNQNQTPSLTHRRQHAKATHVHSPDPTKQNQTQQTEKKILCFVSEVTSTRADYAIYNYFTLRMSSKWDVSIHSSECSLHRRWAKEHIILAFISELP